MNAILLFASIGMITGLFIVFQITPLFLSKEIVQRIETKKKTMKDDIKISTKRKKEFYIIRELTEVREILEMTGRGHKYSQVTALSLFFFIIGASIAIILGNWFLVPVLAVGFMLLPLWYVRVTQSHFKRDITNELETALSIMTTGYLRTENIVTAIEENVEYLNPPVYAVFQQFLYRVKMIDPDITSALQEMKYKIENHVFEEWVDALIQCQYDRNLKSTLTPITTKLSDMRIVNAELEMLITAPRQEFLAMIAFVVCNIPLLYFLNKDWYAALMFSVPGQIVLAICAVAIFFSLAKVVYLTQPIEYKR